MAKRNLSKKSFRMLKEFHRKLKRNGIKATMHPDASLSGSLHVQSVRLPISIDATVTPDCQIELALPYRRYQSSPNAAIAIIIELAKKGTL